MGEKNQDMAGTEIRRLNSKPLLRSADVGAVDAEARTVELSFSSEVEYRRWWGIEVLDHGKDSMRLDRITDGAPLLLNHDWDRQIGVIESVRIDADRKGRALVRFSRSAEAEEVFQDVIDRIRSKVSVGYLIHAAERVEVREDEDVFRVTDWEPYEISIVSVPADSTVGVGRTSEMPPEDQVRKAAQTASVKSGAATGNHSSEEPRSMNIKVLRDASGNLVRAEVDENGTIVRIVEMLEEAGASARGAEVERARVRAISDIGSKYGDAELAMRFIGEGKTAEDFQRAMLDKFVSERSNRPLGDQAADANIGMSDKEVRSFSMLRAVRALQPNASKADKDAAAFEFECSRAAEDKYGKQARGILIPADVLNDRAFSTTAPAGGPGSNVVAQNLLEGSFIELLRNKAWLMQRATTLGGLVGNVDIPRQKGATQAYWVGEGGAPTGSEPALDQIHFTPKTLAAFTDITRRLMLQATPDAEQIVRADLLRVMALALDLAGIYGTGSNSQPKGLKLQTGINAVDFATAGQPTFAELVEMETQIALDNADVSSMAYAMNAGVRGYAKTALKFPSTAASGTIWEPGNTVNGYQTSVSNQIASGDVFFGNWADFVIAMWGGLDLTVDPYSLSTSGGTRLVVFQDVDFNVRHVESFCYGSDTVTP